MRGSRDQPAFEAGLRSLSLPGGFQQAHKDVAGDIFREEIIVYPVTDITIDFREILVVNSTDGLRVQPLQAINCMTFIEN
jgi:hypothetical protein